jgi:quercetin dioxygenase-like cupin family protein
MTSSLDQAALELAALYALSALAPDEMTAVERDWRGKPEFWAEVRSLRDAAAGLAEIGPRARPQRDLWPEIRARVGHAQKNAQKNAPTSSSAGTDLQVWKHWRGAGDSAAVIRGDIVPGADGVFEATSIAGIRVRCLFVDERAERVTMLVRMEAGTAYPAHRHGGVEECYVLEGDLSIGDETEMHAGDYQCMEHGSMHPVQSTRAGCLLLITSSQEDELV